jgi:hypothetical protein
MEFSVLVILVSLAVSWLVELVIFTIGEEVFCICF